MEPADDEAAPDARESDGSSEQELWCDVVQVISDWPAVKETHMYILQVGRAGVGTVELLRILRRICYLRQLVAEGRLVDAEVSRHLPLG